MNKSENTKMATMSQEILFSFGLLGQNQRINFSDFLYGYNPIFDIVKLSLILICIVAIVKILLNSKRSKHL